MKTTAFSLTEQQQAIVRHDRGPALVFAVAGSGKTTAMIHRIERLVREKIFAPEEILATSFNKDANQNIERGLARWPHCQRVQVKTLHALGFQIVREAHRRGALPELKLGRSGHALHTSADKLLMDTVAVVRAARPNWAGQLDGLDREDFLGYVGNCKANLAYAEMSRAQLPRWARKVARSAQRPENAPWYADLYRAFEDERLRQGALTFDDMLMTGWELLCRHEAILGALQQRHRCVIVDEFQDVNLAQAEILDLMTKPERNFMAIGDDDQTIYEWRGASPNHFLNFRRRYRSAVYMMTDNFRCQASQVALANQVIRHNRHRQPKRLSLTQGFGGSTDLLIHENRDEMARSIVARISHALANGRTPAQIAILVRVYAQTPPIQEALMAARIPFVLTENGRESAPSKPAPGVAITTIFKAKGLEWPLVFVPDCNQGVIPLERSGRIEEERRLLYVALTRASQELSLHALANAPLSPFLLEANAASVLETIGIVSRALKIEPLDWGAEEYAAVAINAQRLELYDYFGRWWQAEAEHRRAIAAAVLRFYARAQQVGVFRQLEVGQTDVEMWRTLAGPKADLTPLVTPETDAFLEQFRRTRPKRRWFGGR
ncbi:MAG: ATP-dependent helicase [Caldilineaceae bacterium]|nr:ATP-dependent helicase [Caldilineaceae bacterium]